MIFSTFLTLVLSIFLLAPEPAGTPAISGEIAWKNSRKLNWDDFKAKADSKDPLHALTATNIDMKAECENGQLKFKVASLFSTKESWTKNRESERLLFHEQLHFDITEIYARRLRKALTELKDGCNNPEKINQIAESTFAEWKVQEDVYDKETNHGLDQEMMKVWTKKIAAELSSLDAYQEK